MPRIDLFLSHISCEANLADIVVHHVSRDFIGLVNTFASTQASILVGTKWLDEVTTALKKARMHVVLRRSFGQPEVDQFRGWCRTRPRRADRSALSLRVNPGAASGAAQRVRRVGVVGRSRIPALLCRNRTRARILYTPSVDYAAYAREVVTFERKDAEQRKTAEVTQTLEPGLEIVQPDRAVHFQSTVHAAGSGEPD